MTLFLAYPVPHHLGVTARTAEKTIAVSLVVLAGRVEALLLADSISQHVFEAVRVAEALFRSYTVAPIEVTLRKVTL